MAEFKSWMDFNSFKYRTQQQNRYIRTPEDQAFFDAILATSQTRQHVIPTEKKLWRAQIGCEWETIEQDGEYIGQEPAPFPPERMVPKKYEAAEGRGNPQGISYLYLAIEKETAMSEVRPWFTAHITASEFRTLKALKLVDLSSDEESLRYLFEEGELDAAGREEVVWGQICAAFSRPVIRSDSRADYIPTQILAELFRVNGLDGLVYKSVLRQGGKNVLLYDPSVVDLYRSRVFRVKELSYQFDEVSTPYDYRLRSKDDRVEGS
jgi:RES domain.